MASQFIQAGYDILPWEAGADVMVINSCAVTATATSKCRRLLSSVRRRHPNAFIIFCGCAALDAGFTSTRPPFPDILIANPKPGNVPSLLPPVESLPGLAGSSMQVVKPSPLTEGFLVPGVGMALERTRANLKIQEGCSFNCTYCIVPQTRGLPRSRDFNDTLREAEELLSRGCKELVITGVNIATYHNQGQDLSSLLRAILKVDSRGDFRLRLGSTEPGPVLDRLLELMAEEPRICRFLHLPMQYADDGILARMGRHYDCAQYRAVVEKACRLLPGVCIGSDIMAGFPGEDDRAFENCLARLEALPLGLMHVFCYSPRPGTPAASWQRPPSEIAALREARLLALSERKARAFAASQVGECLPVLLEYGGMGKASVPCGWSDNYLKVRIQHAPAGLAANSLVQCRITGIAEDASSSERMVEGVLIQ